MKTNKTSIVITTIFQPGLSLRAIAEGVRKTGWDLIIVGDVASPHDFKLEGASYFDIATQKSLPFKYASLCPERHYTRKNIGYLIAMSNSSDIIVETDDDNIPNLEFWLPRKPLVPCYRLSGSGWANIYSLFTTVKIWPRGFPLEEIHTAGDNLIVCNKVEELYCPLQQGLADENPDVDAVFRMTEKFPVNFEKKGNYHLTKGLWCPFNSQNTTWFTDVFPLLYLPSFCSFRMTDIWRSFVTQRILWECNWGVSYHDATVWQDRNEHSLIKDFEQEVPGYINNNKIKRLLENLPLRTGPKQIVNNMVMCYESLATNGIISDKKEMDLLFAWLEDIETIKKNVGQNC